MGEARQKAGRGVPLIDKRLAALAAEQHSVVHVAQLEPLGLGASAVRKRAAKGSLHRIHRGVYALIPRTLLTREGHWIAAVLACGEGAVLSHRSAAALHELRSYGHSTVEVTASGRDRPGITVHRSLTLTPKDVTRAKNIPCTTTARTILDLADVVNRRQVERAIDQLEVSNRFDLLALRDQIERNESRPAAATLKQILDAHSPGRTATWSELEEQFLSLIRDGRLPEPEVNAWVTLPDGERAIRVDFLWRAQRLIVETDGYRTHKTRQSFENDRRNDQRLMAASFNVIRPTWRQIRDEPLRLQQTLATLLAPRAA